MCIRDRSYDHLEKTDSEAAQVFPLLALFPGGASEAAVKAVLGPEALPAVGRLRAASLLETADGGRARLPGPARAYAERRLPPGARERYGPPGVAHYLALMESMGQMPLSHESGLSLAMTLAELPNLHAFADWGLAQEGKTAAPAARLVSRLRNLYMLLAWPEEGVARLRRAAEAARRAGDARSEADTLQAIGDVQQFRDERDAALESYRQALHLFRAVGDRLGEANTLESLGNLYLAQGDGEKALQTLDQALDLYRQTGSLVGQANIYWDLGLHLAQSGNLQEAEPLLAQAVELAQQFAPSHPVTLQWGQTLAQVRARLEGEQAS